MSQELQDGVVFANRYRVVRCIARGGMGAVYEVVHLGTERRRALKVMHGHILHSADLRSRFEREAKVAAQVESEFIVDVFDAGVDEATEMPFLVMELLRGEEVGKRLRRLGRLPAVEVAHYLHQTALALDKTHHAGIVHRDLKPENLFLTAREDGLPRIKVLDFGIAKVVTDGITSGASTMSIGTPLYMSPEQFRPRAVLTAASDIYALGMIAYTLLVGAAYWEEESREGSIFQFGAIAINGPQEAASVRAEKRGVRLPAGFDAWFAKVTAADPEQRFATATAAAHALGALLGLAPQPPSPAPFSLPDGSARPTGGFVAARGAGEGEKTLVMAPLSERVEAQSAARRSGPFFPPPGPAYTPGGPVLTPSGPLSFASFAPPGPALTPSGAALSAAPPFSAPLTGAPASATAIAPPASQEGPDAGAATPERARRRLVGVVVVAAVLLTIGAVAVFAGRSGSDASTGAATAVAATTATTVAATVATTTATAVATTTATTGATATAIATPPPASAAATASAAVAAATGEPPRTPRVPAATASTGQTDKLKKPAKKRYTQE